MSQDVLIWFFGFYGCFSVREGMKKKSDVRFLTPCFVCPGYGVSKRRENDNFLFCRIYSILTIWILRTLQYVITKFWGKFGHPTSTLGKEKYLLSVSDRFRSWGAEIVRNGYFFLFGHFCNLIEVYLSSELKKKL